MTKSTISNGYPSAMSARYAARSQRAPSSLLEGPGSTDIPLLDQPIFTNVWDYLNASDKKVLRQGCKPLRHAVDEHVASLALLGDAPRDRPAGPRFFEAAGHRWPQTKRLALTRVTDVQTLLSPSKYGGLPRAAFPRLQALTVRLVRAWLLCTQPLVQSHVHPTFCRGPKPMHVTCGARVCTLCMTSGATCVQGAAL